MGANIDQQFLAAGLVDEIRIHLVDVLLGGGRRLFDQLPQRVELEQTGLSQTGSVTHLAYRVPAVAVTTPDVDAAARFLAGHARVLDRRRFERLFFDGDARPVRDAVAAFRNSDGGFGHALEPDGRMPGSQPAAVMMALDTLDEADAWDEELVAGACDWLAANAPAAGGASFVEPTVEGWPHAPWWEADDGRSASLLTTGGIAGTLHARRVEHPWLDGATDLLWRRIDDLDDPGPYGFRGVLKFLQHVPDSGRAEQAFVVPGGDCSTGTWSRSTPTPRARFIRRSTSPRAPTRSPVVSSTTPRSRRTSTTWARVRQTTEAGRSTGRPGRRSPRASGADRGP